MYFTSILSVFLYWLHVSNETSVPIHTYDSLLSHLTSGTRVTYFFNTTTCQPLSSSANVDLPVFGGEINFFLTSKSSNGQLIFNHDSFIDHFMFSLTSDVIDEEIQSVYIVAYTALILYGRPGVFVNSTENIKGVICNWTAENTFWAKESTKPSQLNSYSEIRKSLMVGDAIRFVTTTAGCKCQDDCGDVYFGGDLKEKSHLALLEEGGVKSEINIYLLNKVFTVQEYILAKLLKTIFLCIADFKIKSDGMLTFSKSMTLYFPVPTSPMYYRELLTAQIQPNNTATFQLLYLNATTWEIGNGAEMVCSIEASRGHADFFNISA
ncbi:uncharacterized protein LOC134271239 [Saccostrea cucullata]|uniref:uncharacterized protein LOC134271239 n=1 Tax=Saccostrea cuccullata TaxID=36930 RepID=UPI002ED4B79E